MATIKHALIIGGGIAGPMTAQALHKAGIEATIYEAYASSAEGIGGTLMIAPNGLDALRTIGLEDAVCAIGQPITRMVIANSRGKALGEFTGMPGLPPSQLVWRTDLYRVLQQQALANGIPVEFGKRLVNVVETPSGVTARFADGSSASGDVLIGADGIRSTVRRLIDPQAQGPQYTGILGFGGYAEGSGISAPADAMHFVFGKNAFLGYWGESAGRTLWFGSLPYPEALSASQARAIPAADWLHVLRELYADDFPARHFLQHTTDDQLFIAGAGEMLPTIPHWHRGRMVLVGDAVHAPSSSSGQGASLAAESAIQLARSLRDLPDLSQAFSAYEKLRRARVEKVAADAARTNNRKASGPLKKNLMHLLMPIMMKVFFKPEKVFGALHNYRIDWSETVGS